MQISGKSVHKITSNNNPHVSQSKPSVKSLRDSKQHSVWSIDQEHIELIQ